MASKPGFDDEFRPKRQRRSWPVRLFAWMISVVLVSGIALSVAAETGKSKKGRRYSILGAQQAVPVPNARVPSAQASDPFVIVAPAEIDTKMVVMAPAGIDEAMVFNPDRDDRQPVGAPAWATPVIPAPGGQPGQLPYYVVPPGSP